MEKVQNKRITMIAVLDFFGKRQTVEVQTMYGSFKAYINALKIYLCADKTTVHVVCNPGVSDFDKAFFSEFRGETLISMIKDLKCSNWSASKVCKLKITKDDLIAAKDFYASTLEDLKSSSTIVQLQQKNNEENDFHYQMFMLISKTSGKKFVYYNRTTRDAITEYQKIIKESEIFCNGMQRFLSLPDYIPIVEAIWEEGSSNFYFIVMKTFYLRENYSEDDVLSEVKMLQHKKNAVNLFVKQNQTQVDYNKMIELYQRYRDVKVVATELGISEEWLLKVLEKQKVTLRRRPGEVERNYGKPVVGTEIKTGERITFASTEYAGRFLMQYGYLRVDNTEVAAGHVMDACEGVTKQSGGFVWQYA